MPSRMPICDPNPKDNSIEKNKKLQKGEPGSLVNASAITMNASPEMEKRNCFLFNQDLENGKVNVKTM